jgi:hypothetical protein
VTIVYLLLALFLCLSQADSLPEKWSCGGKPDRVSNKQITRLKSREMDRRVVSCKMPRLTGNGDAKGPVVIEVLVNETGDAECLRAVTGHPIIRGAALEAVKQWKFKPLIVERRAKPYLGIIAVYVSWDANEMRKHCSALGKPNSGVLRRTGLGNHL